MSAAPLGLGAAAAVAVSLGLCGLIARSGPVDAPRERGVHRAPTPTTGGLAILAATCLGAALPGAVDAATTAALGIAAGLGVYAAADDLFDLGALAKLIAQLAAAAAFVVWVAAVSELPIGGGIWIVAPPLVAMVGTAAWLVVLGNAVNFMDGADGVASGSVAIAASAVGVVAVLNSEPAVAAAALALAASTAGFLPWNLSRRLFQGDAGALFASFALGALGALLAARGSASPYLVPLATLPLLTDALGTLLMRALKREPIWRAHKQHLYQRWLAVGGGSHLGLSLRVWALALLCAGLAVWAELDASGDSAAVAFAGALAAFVVGWLVLRRRLA